MEAALRQHRMRPNLQVWDANSLGSHGKPGGFGSPAAATGAPAGSSSGVAAEYEMLDEAESRYGRGEGRKGEGG